jgi:NIMA-interacting peptidyl-prolyl cis-trans isomerase 1
MSAEGRVVKGLRTDSC